MSAWAGMFDENYSDRELARTEYGTRVLNWTQEEIRRVAADIRREHTAALEAEVRDLRRRVTALEPPKYHQRNV